MPKVFNYKVRNQQGRTFTGTIEADDQAAAARILRSEGNLILELKETPLKSSFLSRNGGPDG